jgi:hypothetical protein
VETVSLLLAVREQHSRHTSQQPKEGDKRMTISKGAWERIHASYAKHFLPHPSVNEGKIPDNVLNLENIQMIIEDVPARLRNIGLNPFSEDQDRSAHFILCSTFLERLFAPIHEAFDKPDPEIFGLCVDPQSMRRPEKMGTFLKRQRPSIPGVPDRLQMPFGQCRYFEHDKPFPGSMDLVFSTPEAKAELYEYILLYMMSDNFYAGLPPGKQVIFAGGHLIDRTPDERGEWVFSSDKLIRMSPIQLTRSGMVELHDLYNPEDSEADVMVYRFIHAFPTKNFHVRSYDCDVLLIGLIQMRFIKEAGSQRIGWFVTRRGSGESDFPTDKEVETVESNKRLRQTVYDKTLAETGSIDEASYRSGFIRPAGSYEDPEKESRKRARRVPNWIIYYIDLFGVYDDIINEARGLVHYFGLEELKNPVEIYAAILAISCTNHDFIEAGRLTPGVGAHFVWITFLKNIQLVGDLIQVYEPQIRPASEEGSSSTLDADVFDGYHYVIDTERLRTLIDAVYLEKACTAVNMSKKNNTEVKLAAARKESARKNMEKAKLTPEIISTVAAQIVWTLHYWANGGMLGNPPVVDGTTLDPETGLSIYGFLKTGWADKVEVSRYKIAPPL